MGRGVEARFERYTEVMVRTPSMLTEQRRRAGICAG